MLRDFLFPRSVESCTYSLFLLAMRIVFGLLLLLHGVGKLLDFENIFLSFPDPLSIGSQFSLMLVIFAEMACSMAVIFGLLFRLSLIPIIVSMAVAFIGVHEASVMQGELSFIYLLVFVMLFISGPGRYSLDHMISRAFKMRELAKDS